MGSSSTNTLSKNPFENSIPKHGFQIFRSFSNDRKNVAVEISESENISWSEWFSKSSQLTKKMRLYSSRISRWFHQVYRKSDRNILRKRSEEFWVSQKQEKAVVDLPNRKCKMPKKIELIRLKTWVPSYNFNSRTPLKDRFHQLAYYLSPSRLFLWLLIIQFFKTSRPEYKRSFSPFSRFLLMI